METGQTTSTPGQPFPAVKHLVWALVAGTALVISGTRDDRPPPPPTAGTAAPAPAVAPAGTTDPAPAVATGSRPAGPARALAYLAPERPVPEGPVYVGRPAVRPAPLSLPPVRPAPLRPLPAGPVSASPVQPSSGEHRTSGPAPAGPEPGRAAASPRPAVSPLAPSTPLRLRIPALTVDAPMMKLALNATGALEPPPDNNPVLAGWYAGGTVPGAVGTAVAAGHVDTRLGPGVFHRLGSLRRGAVVEIVRADGRTAVFTVYAVETYDKKSFPDRKVYGPSNRPELRVITCGGDYDKKSGYRGNVVVFATLTATR
ncbi:class F sortase [Streptomyces sp. NPDC006296]|uniref:class F sortase n=1 Tax=Streptomyces sp. NPDC006296 TaxID=3156746 RepID=UPI0033A4A1FD